MTEEVQILDEKSQWKSREIEFLSGPLPALMKRVPTFEFAPFQIAPDEPENPHYQSVVRLPLGAAERRVPVALVSKTYALVQHHELIECVARALEMNGIAKESVRFELGLTALGELMVFRAYLESLPAFEGKDGENMALRLECINSVDGSYRLVVLLGWFRFICLNGLVIGKSLTEIRLTHSRRIELQAIAAALQSGLVAAETDRKRLGNLEEECCSRFADFFEGWVNTTIAEKWNKTAATKVFHALLGQDVEIDDAFSPASPSQKPVRVIGPVPGSKEAPESMYDVAQALAFVASRRTIFEDRVSWQAQIPDLLDSLRTRGGTKLS